MDKISQVIFHYPNGNRNRIETGIDAKEIELKNVNTVRIKFKNDTVKLFIRIPFEVTFKKDSKS